jgi:hypothetical protein
MNKHSLPLTLAIGLAAFLPTSGATLTVTTTDNSGAAAGQTSLAQALARVADGDTIQFNIPGAGPHYIATPTEGYALVTAGNVTLDGYSQSGASPNANPILASNNAKIKIFLDSRNGGRSVLDVDGYGTSESAILAFLGGTNVTVRGLGFLGRIGENTDGDPSVYCVAFGRKAAACRVNGCWLGVDADGRSVFGANAAVTGFRYREDGVPFLADDMVIGVTPGTKKPEAEFNVIAGMKVPIAIEGNNLRVSGNFIGVLPSGTNEFNNAVAGLPNEGAIQIGRTDGNIVIGTDGDGINDAAERNVFAGVISKLVDPAHGYGHLIEFYGGGLRTNIIIAGNYIGIGVDGVTRFTNGVPVVSGLTGTARIGSNFDGVSDSIEGNSIFNNYPPGLFTGETLSKDFLENTSEEAFISLRGNKLVNNFTPPVSLLRDGGAFLANYCSKVMLSPDAGVVPTLSPDSSVVRLVGTLPVANPDSAPLNIIDLYLADPEGIATGKAEALPQFPDGFVQGLTYLGSFFEGSVNDTDPEPGRFAIDIGALNIPVGAILTVTANYTGDPLGTRNPRMLTTPFSNPVAAGKEIPVITPPPSSLSIAANGGSLTLTFAGGVLQSAASVSGPWSDVAGATSPFKTTADQRVGFFRTRSR